jgi:hypothetical protein
MRRKDLLVFIVLALLLGMPAMAYDDDNYEAEEEKETLIWNLGVRSVSSEDARFRVAEYETTGSGPLVGVQWYTSPYEDATLGIRFHLTDNDDFNAGVSVDLGRVFRLEATGDSMLHRLGHDPLTNLQAVADIKVVRSTDMEPGAQYSITRKLYEIHAEIFPPSVAGLSLRAGYSDQTRKGFKQILTTSHCTSCHTVGQGREVDSSITDAMVGIHFTRGLISLDYELISRTYKDAGAMPTTFYEVGIHPASLGAGFNDRLWFQDGFFASGQVPDLEKTIHKFQVAADFKGGNGLDFTIVESRTKNTTAGLDFDFTGYRGRYTWRIGDTLKLNLWGKQDKVKSDATSIDLVEMNGLTAAGVTSYGGTVMTYQNWRRLVESDPTLNFESFTRNSAYDRTSTRLGFDTFWRPRRGTALRLGVRQDTVDRDNTILSDGTGETDTTTVKLNWNERVGENWRFNNSVTMKARDNAYANINGGMRAYDPLAPFPISPASPKNPESVQYYQLYQLRVADLTNTPSDELRYRGTGTWMPSAKTALNANIRYLNAENDELDYSTMEKDSLGFGVNLWTSPAPKFNFMIGFDHFEQETGVLMAIPLMDG